MVRRFRSYDHKNGKTALHLLMAFCGNNKLILGHVNVTEHKTNEIPCAQNLIWYILEPVCRGTIFTITNFI